MVFLNPNSEQDNGEFSARKADLIDKHVGQRLRERRRSLELSQQDIARMLGISYQQVQKYECGLNRISAGRLYMLANIMRVTVSHFYEGVPSVEAMHSDQMGATDKMRPIVDSLPNTNIRDALGDLVRAIRDSDLK